MDTTIVSPQEEMMKLVLGKWIAKPMHVAAELGIADILSGGPKSIEELARKTDCHADTLYRLMRALACVGIFSETADGRFELTPMAACLQSDQLRPVVMMMHADWHDKAWGHLLESVKTGGKAFDKVHGMPAFEWFDAHPAAARTFNDANAVKAMAAHPRIVDAYDFSGMGSLVDIGGGNGALLLQILKANPPLKGVVADLAPVAVQARENIRRQGLEDRCQAVACDFFKQVPVGFDAFLMFHILHDWDDGACRKILETCLQAMQPGARLLVVEAILPDGNAFSIAKLMDLEVFVMGGGRERTEAEFRNLFRTSGFELSRVIATADYFSIMELAPAPQLG